MTTQISAPDKVRQTSARSPLYFYREILGAHPHMGQRRILRALRMRRRRISVVGANGTGKDWTTGRMSLWWLNSFFPAKVIVTGPTRRQIEDIIFGELTAAHANALYPLGGKLYDSPRLVYVPGVHFMRGFSTSDPFNLQGYHSPNLLVIVTEAHAMKDTDIDALRRLNPKCFIMTGNPLTESGRFFDSFHQERHLYEPITISAFDLPNLDPRAPDSGFPQYPGMVTREDVNDRRDEYGEDSPLYIAGVKGEFPDNLDDVMVPLRVANEAQKRTTGPTEGADIVLGLDVARYGRDKTVLTRRQGQHARIIWKTQGRSISEIVGFVWNYILENQVDIIVIDDNGVGGGVTDGLIENEDLEVMAEEIAEMSGDGYEARTLPTIVPFNAGSKPRDEKRYVNAGSEAWALMRDWFFGQRDFVGYEADIDPDERDLVGQLATRKYEWISDRRMRVQSKKQMTKSPDEADSLAMTFAPSGGRISFDFV